MSKIVLITGCASGFGLAMVPTFLNDGWRVIATVWRPENSSPLQQIKHPLLTCLKLDVTSAADQQQIQTYIADNLNNQLDCLINNAGFGFFGVFEEFSEEQIREQLEVNTIGLMLVTQKCLPALRKSKGRIINIASVAGYLAVPMLSTYTASKFAVEGFTESLSYELEPHGVQVAIIEPGVIKTNFVINAKQSENTVNGDVYLQQKNELINARALMIKRSQNTTPHSVATVALKLVNRKKMPLRTRVGVDAKLLYLLRRLLPAGLFLILFKQYCQRVSK